MDLGGAQKGAAPPRLAKRPADYDPATLREDESGRSKRQNVDQGGKRVPVNSGSGRCSACFDRYDKVDILQLPCKGVGETQNHAYCRECLKRLFETCISDTSSFPPRCCSKAIPLASCVRFISKALVDRFIEKRDELNTVNPTYCSNSKCAKWIRGRYIVADVATCPHCSRKTCAQCKGKPHQGLCPEDPDVRELINMAREKNWKTCPECKNMVELDRGCYHIM
jgi:hypothetical protein